MADASMNIISRAQWGARHGDGRFSAPLPADEVWLHHSATIAPDLMQRWDDDFAAIRTIERIGAERFGQVYGFPYTFGITPAGLVFAGHHIAKTGAHTAGHNSRGRGICLVGNYDNHKPPPPMLDALVWLLRHGHAQGWWRAPRLTGGHRDVKATACPGRHAYASIAEVNHRAATPQPRRGSEDHHMLLTLPATPAPTDLASDPRSWPRSREISRPLLPPAPGNWRGAGSISSLVCGWAIDAGGNAQQRDRPSGYIEYLRVFHHGAGGPNGYRDLKHTDLLKDIMLAGNWSAPPLALPDWTTSFVIRYAAPSELGLGIEYEH